jgi:hypothetical protein
VLGGCTIGIWPDTFISNPPLSSDELARQYRAAKEPHERSWWHILWLLSRGQTATAIADSSGYSRYCIGQLAKRYNEEGPAGMTNRQHTTSRREAPLLAPPLREELRQALAGPAPEHDLWTGRTVAEWPAQALGRPVSNYRGWVYLRRLQPRPRHGTPRTRHVLADPEQQKDFKKPPPLAEAGRDGLPPGDHRTMGHRRASHRPQTAPVQSVVALCGEAPPRPDATSIPLALARRLRPSGYRPHPLPSGHRGEH